MPKRRWPRCDAPRRSGGTSVCPMKSAACICRSDSPVASSGDADGGRLELEASRRIFTQLGATTELARVEKLIEQPAAATGDGLTSPRNRGAATHRQRQDQSPYRGRPRNQREDSGPPRQQHLHETGPVQQSRGHRLRLPAQARARRNYIEIPTTGRCGACTVRSMRSSVSVSYHADMESEHVETLVIGGGQAGLSVGYHLARRGRPFVILDANERIGDSWRQRWDSLRLFTPARYDSLDGMPFPAPPHSFPTKDAMADYLEAYAAHFKLPVRSGMTVEHLRRDGRRVHRDDSRPNLRGRPRRCRHVELSAIRVFRSSARS